MDVVVKAQNREIILVFPSGSSVIVWALKRWKREVKVLSERDSSVSQTWPDFDGFADGRGQEPRKEVSL